MELLEVEHIKSATNNFHHIAFPSCGRLYKMPSFNHKFSVEEIKSATNNFNDAKLIGYGGFGKVYKGQLSHSSTVAVKRLDRQFGRGDCEFFNEIAVLARYKHPNLISLLGFCNEGDEKIIVYEYASKGSLDCHITSTHLTWSQRLKICIDVAMGLKYLHDATGNKEIVIHRDIKTSNILLDENWIAKISDFGLSRTFPNTACYLHDATGNKERLFHGDVQSSNILLDADWSAKISDFGLSRTLPNTSGTLGYMDPEYMKTGFRTKGTDVYSFGVVLFEVFCGRFYNNDDSHAHMWKKSYEQNNLQEFVFNDLKQQVDGNSLKIFSVIAFKCLQTSREKQPTMSQILERLQAALDCQMLYEGVKPTKGYKQRHMEDPPNYKDLLMITLEDPLNNIPETELKMLLLKGTLLNRGKTWFSLNKEGEHCEMISIVGCLTSASEPQHYLCSPEYSSRFAGGCYEPFGASFKTRVQAQFLTPGITYAVNLVFKNKSKSRYIGLEYKLKGERSSCYSFISDEREDGWLAAELYQFTSDRRTADLEIWFYTDCCPTMLVEGIEFRPLKKVHEVFMDDKVDMQPIIDRETYWEQKLPSDYEDMIKRSKDSVQWKTKEDLFSILCKGFQFSYGEEWFYLDKYGKKCLMLPARAILEEDRWTWNPEPKTRFEEVACCNFDTFGIFCKFSSKMLSPQTTYTAFLVYKLPDDHESIDQPPPVQVVDKDSDSKEVYNIFLRTPQTPVISWNEKEEKTFKPSNKPKNIKGLPKRRSDGWMEVQVLEFQTRATIKMLQKKVHAHELIKMISTRLKFSSYDTSLKGVVVQGLAFRPAV